MVIDPRLIDLTPKEPIDIDTRSNPVIETFEAQLLKRYMIKNFDLIRGLFEEVKADIGVVDDYLDLWKSGFVFPEEFGAVGDGVANDNAALQSAIDTEKVVLIRQGKTYAITNLYIREREHILGIGGEFVTHSSVLTTEYPLRLVGDYATVDGIKLTVNHPVDACVRLRPRTVPNGLKMRFINNHIIHNSTGSIFEMERNGASGYFYDSLIANNIWDASGSTHTSTLSFFRGARRQRFVNNTLLVGTSPTDAWRWFDSQELYVVGNKVVYDAGNLGSGRAFRFEPNLDSDYIIFTENYWRAPRGCTFINLDNAVVGDNIGHCTLLNGYWMDAFGFDNIITHDNIMRVNGATYLVNYILSATKTDVDNIKN